MGRELEPYHLRCPVGEFQNNIGQNSDEQYTKTGDQQREPYRPWREHFFCGERFAEPHYLHNSQVVEGRNNAVKHWNNNRLTVSTRPRIKNRRRCLWRIFGSILLWPFVDENNDLGTNQGWSFITYEKSPRWNKGRGCSYNNSISPSDVGRFGVQIRSVYNRLCRETAYHKKSSGPQSSYIKRLSKIFLGYIEKENETSVEISEH